MPQLSLTPEEAVTPRTVLEHYVSDLRMEIARHRLDELPREAQDRGFLERLIEQLR